MELSQIKQFISGEYSAASQEVHNFVAWLEGKDNEIKSALSQMEAARSILTKAGYTITVTPPAA